MNDHYVFHELGGAEVGDQGATSEDAAVLGFSAEDLKGLYFVSTRVQKGGVFSISQDTIRARHYVGSFSFFGTTFEIIPRLISDPHDLARGTNNLLWMVSRLDKDWGRFAERGSLSCQHVSILDNLTRHLADLLLSAVQQGLPQLYIPEQQLLSAPRGRILFAESFWHNAGNQARWLCAFDDLSPDHTLLHGVRSALRFVAPLIRTATTRVQLEQALLRTALPRDQEVSYSDLANLQAPPVNAPFAEAVSLAKVFLQHKSMSLQAGADVGPCFVFDMRKTFELYLLYLLQEYQRPLGIQQVESQGAVRFISSIQDCNASNKNWPTKNSYFDIRTTLNSGKVVIFDAKYKEPVSGGSKKRLPLQAVDIYQEPVPKPRKKFLIRPQTSR